MLKQAMVFAAGMGTRLKPMTEHTPKALVRVGEKPLLEHVLLKLKKAGAAHVVVNVHHFSQQIIDFLRQNDNFGMEISISDESDMLLETGGGIKKALEMFDLNLPVLVHNVDILSNLDLSAFWKTKDGNATKLVVNSRNTGRYLLFNDNMRLMGWTNLKTDEIKSPYPQLNTEECKKMAFCGIHLLAPQIFPYLQDMPQRFGIMDLYLKICQEVPIQGYFKEDLRCMDVGKIEMLQDAQHFLDDIQDNRK